jgi:HEAT repeat protein
MELQKFRERVQELLGRRGLHQKDLADYLHLREEYLSQMLNGRRPLIERAAKGCILYLAQEEAIVERADADDLLAWASCGDFSPTDWRTWPLKDLLSPESSAPPALPRRALPVDHFDPPTARAKYLERVIRLHSSLILPASPQETFDLKVVFQHLRLRQDPDFAEFLTYRDRRALLDEPTRSEDDPRRAVPEGDVLAGHADEDEGTSLVIATDGFDALNHSPQRRMVILGPPGIGKTTLLKYLVAETARKAQADPAQMLPLFISLPDFERAGGSVQDYLFTVVGALGVDSRFAPLLWQAIEQGKAFVCLDGLEQMTPDRRRESIAWINLQAAEPGNAWIISSRFNEYNGGQFSPHFLEWELYPMNHESRVRLAQGLLPELSRHVTALSDASSPVPSEFVAALESHARAVNWGKNPLLFSLAAGTFVRIGTFPSSRAALYGETVAAIIAARQVDRNRQVELRRIIAALTFRLYVNQRRIFTREELIENLKKVRSSQDEIWKPEEIAQDIIDTGIVEVVARDVYGFCHQTFQEYFSGVEVARRLVDRDTRRMAWGLAWQKHIYSRWTEVLRLMVGTLIHEYAEQGGVDIALSWLQALVDQRVQEQGDVGDLGLALAITSLGEVSGLAALWRIPEWAQLEEKIVCAWVGALLDALQRDQEVQQKRLLRLSDDMQLLNPATLALLERLLEAELNTENAHRRSAIVYSLGKLGRYTPIQRLVTALDDPHKQVRAAAIRTLVELEDRAPVDALVAALANERAAARVAAIEALGELRRPALVRELQNSLLDKEWSVRVAAVKALGNLGGDLPRGRLVECLYDENDLVRWAAVEALGKLGGDLPLDELLVLLDDPDDGVRSEVIEVLGERTPFDKLVEEVLNPPDTQFLPTGLACWAAEKVLAALGEQELLQRMLSQGLPDNQDLRDLVRSIVESRQPSPLEEILAALNGNNAETRVQALAILNEKREWERLEQFVLSPETANVMMRATALRMVGKVGEQTLVRQALLSLHDSDPKVRLTALSALKDLGKRAPREAMAAERLLEDEDWLIRTAALQVLSCVLPRVSVSLTLLETLLRIASADMYEPAQRAAQECLEKAGKRITKTQFASLLSHQDAKVRYSALKELSQYLPLKLIGKASFDEDEEVGYMAFLAFEKRKRRHKWMKRRRTVEPYQPRIEIKVEAYAEVQLLKQLCGDTMLQQLNSTAFISDGIESIADLPLQVGSNRGEMLLLLDRTVDTPLSKNPSVEAYSALERGILQQTVRLLREYAPVDGLIAALADEKRDIRAAAIQALAERTPREKLLAALDDEDCVVRREALRVLDVRTPVQHLLHALQDEFDIVRKAASEILGKLVSGWPEPELIAALESKNPLMRVSAIRVLRRRAPAEKLLAALGDSSEEVRLAALESLLQNHPETNPLIVAEISAVLIQNRSSTIIEPAVQSFLLEVISHLEQITPALRSKLTELLASPYWEVQMKAAQALGNVRRNIPQEAIERLLELRNHSPSQTVRDAADDALAELLSLEIGLEDQRMTAAPV